LLNAELEQRVDEKSAERDRLWRTSQDLLAVVGPDGVFQAANPAWTTILGWREDEVVGRHHLALNHPDDQAGSTAALELAGRDRLPAYENWTLHKDGSYRRISWVAAAEGGLVYASGRHITAEHEAREELAQTQEALRQSQKMEAVGQLTGGIAHDFNNLLMGISGSLEAIERRFSAGQVAGVERFISTAQESTRRAAALTQRLLAFARRQTLDPRPLDANRMIAGMADLINRTVGPAVKVEVVQGVGLWPTKVDPSQLENALLNLCINGRDAMAPNGGILVIETANKWLDVRAARERELTPGQYVSLCVTDTGTGMPADVIAKAFDPFFTTKPLGQGTGLGLSMIYGFLRQSGGQVRVYSEVGKGTTMCLYLPRFTGSEGVPSDVEEAAVDRGDGETVLVIDDEPAIRMLVTEALEENGYQVIQAEDGPGGLKVLQTERRIDLLITDVGLPGGLNGRQVADAARETRPELRVLFITGFAENAVVGNGHLEAGMAVITKPFVMAALANRVRELLDG
jgi:PAS domain S-box-containing protein